MKLEPPRMRARTLRALAPLSLLVATACGAAFSGLLEPVALLLTVGGSLGVTWLTFSRARLESAWKHVVALLRERPTGDEDGEAVIASLKRLARIYRVEGGPALERAAGRERDVFLRTAVERTLECADVDELRDSLLGDVRRLVNEGEAARAVLLTLGKLLPAFGLIGTLIGLAILLPAVGAGDVAAAGPSLGLSILTTLYGAVLSNVVVLPIATKLQSALARRALVLQMIVLGAELLHRRAYPTEVERSLRSFGGLATLPPTEVTLLTDRAA